MSGIQALMQGLGVVWWSRSDWVRRLETRRVGAWVAFQNAQMALARTICERQDGRPFNGCESSLRCKVRSRRYFAALPVPVCRVIVMQEQASPAGTWGREFHYCRIETVLQVQLFAADF